MCILVTSDTEKIKTLVKLHLSTNCNINRWKVWNKGRRIRSTEKYRVAPIRDEFISHNIYHIIAISSNIVNHNDIVLSRRIKSFNVLHWIECNFSCFILRYGQRSYFPLNSPLKANRKKTHDSSQNFIGKNFLRTEVCQSN